MTTSPIANLAAGMIPGPAAPSAGQPGSSGSTADAFLALVQGLLDEATAQPVVDAAATVPGAVDGSAEVLDGALAGTEGTDALVDLATNPDASAAAMVVPVFAPQSIQIQQAAPTQPQPMAPEASSPIDAVTSVASATIATATAAAPAATTATAATAVTAATATTPTVGENRTTALPVDAPAPATTGSAPKVELPGVAVQAVEQRPAAADQAAGQTGGQATTPAPATAAPAAAPTQTPTVAPVTVVAPVTTVAPATTDTSQVTQQVFPEVVRVVNNPNGPQRVTIKLNPEALGEVRVVLTSRQGALEVSLAAGSDARAAITEGASELHRLLDLVGRGDARVVVRELFGTAPGTTISQPTAAPSGSGVPTDLAGGAGTGTGRPGGEAASGEQSPNHAHPSATDGDLGTTNPSRPTDPVTRAHSGLDVTM